MVMIDRQNAQIELQKAEIAAIRAILSGDRGGIDLSTIQVPPVPAGTTLETALAHHPLNARALPTCPTAATAAASLRNGRMIEAETETAEIPIKKTAQVVLPMGSTSRRANVHSRRGRRWGVFRCSQYRRTFHLVERRWKLTSRVRRVGSASRPRHPPRTPAPGLPKPCCQRRRCTSDCPQLHRSS
jgi:hypothetical protein